MFSRAALLGCLVALAFVSPAQAQIDSEGMGDLNAWGTRYLDTDEAEFPSNLWSGSDDETLLSLLKTAQTSNLTPSERKLLRRVVLSPTRRPTGDRAEELLAERARLMLELGEAKAAAALAPRLKQDARGLDAETIAVDLEMASGLEASACERLNSPVPEGAYWLKLRAVCAILQENYSGAELAVEMASAQGLNDPWFVEATFAASGDVPNPPNARFDTGLNIALSSKADLDTSRVTLSATRPDLAAAAARRPGVPAELRARFAQIAGEIELISATERRQILIEQLEDPEHTPSSNIEQTLQILLDPLSSIENKAERLNAILSAAATGNVTTYASTAKLFKSDLETLPRVQKTVPYALTYARAAMAAGDAKLARSWIAVTEFEGAPEADAYNFALLEVLDLIAGGENSSASQRAIQDRLIEAAKTDAQKAHAANILTLWTGFGLRLKADTRGFLLTQETDAPRVDPYSLIAIQSAARSGAIGETAMMILTQTKGAPEEVSSADLAVMISALRTIGAGDIASGLALEASGFWKE